MAKKEPRHVPNEHYEKPFPTQTNPGYKKRGGYVFEPTQGKDRPTAHTKVNEMDY